MRVVVDTNVLLAAIATHGLCESLLALCYRDHVVILSEYILAEVAEHYCGKFRVPSEQAGFVVDTLRSQSEMVTPAQVPADAFEDIDDLPILGTAIAARAECIVTGGQALLALGEYQGVLILSPRAFYERIRG